MFWRFVNNDQKLALARRLKGALKVIVGHGVNLYDDMILDSPSSRETNYTPDVGKDWICDSPSLAGTLVQQAIEFAAVGQ